MREFHCAHEPDNILIDLPGSVIWLGKFHRITFTDVFLGGVTAEKKIISPCCRPRKYRTLLRELRFASGKRAPDLYG